jgi:4-hydroxy-3-polyprenylbenzoate decarboxylase
VFQNLREFISALDKAGELKKISNTFSPLIEISKITDQESKSFGGGKALLFQNVRNSSFPVATNLFGSNKRICMALGVSDLDQLGARVREYIEFNPPRNFKEALNAIPMAIQLANFFPRMFKGKNPPCQEIVYTGDQVDLSKIPVLHCWPGDAGPFVTLPLVFTKSLKTGKRNAGMYRLQVFDQRTTGMHWHIHKDGSHYFKEYQEAGKRMPVAVAIGADPATIYSATAPMPRGIDEMMLSGFIRKKPVRMTRCITIDMEVPAEAEFVLEGYVDPDERRLEGPFGDHTGYYSLADEYPVFHVTAITHRKNPIYNATLVGPPPMEDCYLAKATERLFLPMIQSVMPEIRDYWFPWEGVFHNIVIVSIEKEFQGHAQKLMSGLWGSGQMSFCKAIVVVDQEVNPQDAKAVFSKFLTSFDITSDITLTKGILDVLDHSSPFPNFGSKIGIDLTERFQDEPPRSKSFTLPEPPETQEISDTVLGNIEEAVACRTLDLDLSPHHETINRILFITVQKTPVLGGREISEKILEQDILPCFTIFILFDKEIDMGNYSLMLWKIFNNVAPDRDIRIKNHRMVIDSCRKGKMDGHEREWPDELRFDL